MVQRPHAGPAPNISAALGVTATVHDVKPSSNRCGAGASIRSGSTTRFRSYRWDGTVNLLFVVLILARTAPPTAGLKRVESTQVLGEWPVSR